MGQGEGNQRVEGQEKSLKGRRSKDLREGIEGKVWESNYVREGVKGGSEARGLME